jgi:hypothetical protein
MLQLQLLMVQFVVLVAGWTTKNEGKYKAGQIPALRHRMYFQNFQNEKKKIGFIVNNE